MGEDAGVVRPGAERPVSAGGGVVSRHGLSFGAHYDPSRTSFGALVAHNEDVLAPGAAYGEHDHHDVEIVTWVLSGAMRHRGPDGTEHVVRPGTVQCLAAGTGWHHDEACEGPEPLHLLQYWVAPAPDDPPPGPPSLALAAVGLRPGRPVLVAGGPGALLRLRRPGTALTVARLDAGERWAPRAVRGPGATRWQHVFPIAGSVRAGDVAAEVGDTLEAVGEADLVLDAGPAGADVLLWETVRSA